MNQSTLTLSWPVMATFSTIQGEGFYSGVPAYFIRFAGCDVGCVWCDVKESWDAEKWPIQNLSEIVQEWEASGIQTVVITGGEPAMYDLSVLVSEIQHKGGRVHIETSGAYSLKGNWDWVCFSPKKFKASDPSIYPVADELKVIVYNKSDFKWAEEFADKVSPDCLLLLQPEWEKREEMMPLIIEYVLKNPQWHVSLQTHKYLGVE